MEKNKKLEDRGITLMALVVTIIVLLILAGVSIAVLTGENGILNRATEAKQTNKQKTAEEENPEHVEIQKMMDSLFLKLDALSNFHFIPKPVSV